MKENIVSSAKNEAEKARDKIIKEAQESAENIIVPVFITSKKSEKPNWWSIYEVIPAIGKDFFISVTHNSIKASTSKRKGFTVKMVSIDG